jgi:hypothetical protein
MVFDNLTRFVALDLSACTGTAIANFQMDTDSSNYRLSRDKLVSVTLPSGIKTLGNYAFQNFPNLKTVVLPSSLEAIKTSAFEGCGALTTINLPSSLWDWYPNAFAGTGLVNVVLPYNSKMDIAYAGNLFLGCPDLESVTFPASATQIPSNAFGQTVWGEEPEGCPKLGTIIIQRWNPEGATEAAKITKLPAIGAATIFSSDYVHADIKIYVPNAAAKAFYLGATGWKDVPDIASKLTYEGEE